VANKAEILTRRLGGGTLRAALRGALFFQRDAGHVLNLSHRVALHYAYYNFVKSDIAIRCTPAMAAGVTNTFWTVRDLVEMVEV